MKKANKQSQSVKSQNGPITLPEDLATEIRKAAAKLKACMPHDLEQKVCMIAMASSLLKDTLEGVTVNGKEASSPILGKNGARKDTPSYLAKVKAANKLPKYSKEVLEQKRVEIRAEREAARVKAEKERIRELLEAGIRRNRAIYGEHAPVLSLEGSLAGSRSVQPRLAVEKPPTVTIRGLSRGFRFSGEILPSSLAA